VAEMENRNILYVDDEIVNVQLFNISMSKMFTVFTSESPLRALEILKENDIKVIITDYKMPVMNGMELIMEIKKHWPNAVCIILSGYLESYVIVEKSLIYKYLLKPWNKAELSDIIETAFLL
jgi:two-component system response regulator HupR/HoxA